MFTTYLFDKLPLDRHKGKMGKISPRNYARALLCSLLFNCSWSDCSKAGGTGVALGGAGAEAADTTSVMG